MISKKYRSIITIFTLAVWLGNFLITWAQVLPAPLYEDESAYNPNEIISDNSLTDSNSWSAWQIQQFLLSQGGQLAQYIDPANNLTASDIIYQAAQTYNINPKFLLALIQKEQGLVTDPNPGQNEYDWATGYSCYGGQCLDQYRGFAMQVNSAANRFINNYFSSLTATNCTVTNWCVGLAKTTQDGWIVTPANRVTAALYTYTPYRGGTITDQGKVGANYNFWKIWHNWFGPDEQVTFWPDNTLLKAQGSSTVYVIQNNYRRPLASKTVLISRYDSNNVLTVPSSTLLELPIGPIVRFSQYSLLQTPDQKIYLLVDDTKRLIVSKEAFRKLGFNPEEVESVGYGDLAYLTDGPDLDVSTAFNLGALLKDPKTGGVYYVVSSVKHPIAAPEILKVNFPKLKVKTGTAKQLAGFSSGAPVLFKDGTLIKTKASPDIYVVSQGQKYLIPSPSVFKSRGYNSKNIITSSQTVLDLHPDGDVLQAAGVKQTPAVSALPISPATSTLNISPTSTTSTSNNY